MPKLKHISVILLVFWSVCIISVTGCEKKKTGLEDESFAEFDELISVRYDELKESFSELFDNREDLKAVNKTSGFEVVETHLNESNDSKVVIKESDSLIDTDSSVDAFLIDSESDLSENTTDTVSYMNIINDATESIDKTELESKSDSYNQFKSDTSFESAEQISDDLSETDPISGENTDKKPNIDTVKYVFNKNTKKFHYESCGSSSQIKEKNKGTGTDREALIAGGYKPCKRCNP